MSPNELDEANLIAEMTDVLESYDVPVDSELINTLLLDIYEVLEEDD
jgi:hypothetical protein